MPKHTLLEKASANIGNAMDRIKFNAEMTSEELQKIQSDIQEARSLLTCFNEVNSDTTGFAALLGRSIELVEKALDASDVSRNLI